MPLAFSASQHLTLAVPRHGEHLAHYLDDEERVIHALLDPRQLTPLGCGQYSYAVSRLQVFQLQVQPVVRLLARRTTGRLQLEAIDCDLIGLEGMDDFQLTLQSWLKVCEAGLEGEALLGVSVSQPSMLKLIPPRILEGTGRSLLSGLLLGMRKRVGKQLLTDFSSWCEHR